MPHFRLMCLLLFVCISFGQDPTPAPDTPSPATPSPATPAPATVSPPTPVPATVEPSTFAPTPGTTLAPSLDTSEGSDEDETFPVHFRIIIVLVLVLIACGVIVYCMQKRRPSWETRHDTKYDDDLLDIRANANNSTTTTLLQTQSVVPPPAYTRSPHDADTYADLTEMDLQTSGYLGSDRLPSVRGRDPARNASFISGTEQSGVAFPGHSSFSTGRGRPTLSLDPPPREPSEEADHSFIAVSSKPSGSPLELTPSGRHFEEVKTPRSPLTPHTSTSAKGRRLRAFGTDESGADGADPDALFSGSSRTLRARQSFRGNGPRSLAVTSSRAENLRSEDPNKSVKEDISNFRAKSLGTPLAKDGGAIVPSPFGTES